MLINNIDISVYKARLLTKRIGVSKIETVKEWLRYAHSPIIQGQQKTYIPISLSFSVKGDTEQEVLINISNLMNQLKECTLKFDDLDYVIDCTTDDQPDLTRINSTLYQLDIELEGYRKYKDYIAITANNALNTIINNPGNLEAPAVVEITPSVNLATITVGSFTVKNFTANKTVVVNTEDYLVLQDGVNKFADFDGNFPILNPGTNTINISNASCNINVKFKPRWL